MLFLAHFCSNLPVGSGELSDGLPIRPSTRLEGKGSSSRASIVTMMAITTITVQAATRKRLADYKWGDRTYDDVLNMLMDRVPLEDISRDQIREHYRRLETFRGVSREEFKSRATVGRKSGR